MGTLLTAVVRYVAIYCRLSPRPDGTYEGVEDQERWGRAYSAGAWPGVPVKAFCDKGKSAAAEDQDRPGYDALREAIARGEIVHLWAVEQTRLERREVEWFRLAAELDAAGITELHTNRDGIVRVRDEVAGIKAVLAAGEVRKLKRRVNDRLDAIAAEGRPAGSRLFGYAHGLDGAGGKTLIIIPEEAAAIRDAAGWVLAGWSLSRIAEQLRARGLVGAHGGRIEGPTVRKMVTNPTVAGWRVHRGQTLRRGIWEPILDETTWDAVRDKLATPRVVLQSDGFTYPVNGKRNSTARRYLLTGGTAVCGVCDAALIASMKQLRHGRVEPYYLCHPKTGGRGCIGIMGEEFEDYVRDRLFDELDKPAFLEALAADDHEGERDRITTALRALEGRRKKLAARWAVGDLTDEEWDTARAAQDEQEQALRAELAAVPAAVSKVDVTLIRAGWGAMNLDERREIVGMFIERVIVKRAKPGTKGFDTERVGEAGIVWR